MSDDELMRLLADKPALRHACARTELESWEAREQYWRDKGAMGEDENRSGIATRDVRAELKTLLRKQP